MESLTELGLDTRTAMGFCAEDVDFYREILVDFVAGYEESKGELDDSLGRKDWNEFGVKVHALKSMAKTIGAAWLSDMALGLEEAADEADERRVVDGYPALEAEYARVAEGIEKALKG